MRLRISRSSAAISYAGSADAAVELTLEECALGRAELVFERGLRLDGTGAGHDQFGKFCHGLRCHRTHWRSHHGGKQRQHARIELIGLGEDALRLGEHAHPIRIDDRNRDGGGHQTAMQMAMPLAGRLDRNKCNPVMRQPTLELANASAGVGNMQSVIARQHVSVKPTFADINSHVRVNLGLFVRTLPCLACGTCSLSSVEDKSRRTDGPCSPTVPNTQGEWRSRPSASGLVATGPDAPLSLRQFGFANMQGGPLELAQRANRGGGGA